MLLVPASAASISGDVLTLSFNQDNLIDPGEGVPVLWLPLDRFFSEWIIDHASGYYFSVVELGVSGFFVPVLDEGEQTFLLYGLGDDESVTYPVFSLTLLKWDNREGFAFFGQSSDVDFISAPITIHFSSEPFDDQTGTGSLVNDLGSVGSSFLGVVGDIADTIVSTPLLLLTVGIFFLGGCVAMFGRFMSKD